MSKKHSYYERVLCVLVFWFFFLNLYKSDKLRIYTLRTPRVGEAPVAKEGKPQRVCPEIEEMLRPVILLPVEVFC